MADDLACVMVTVLVATQFVCLINKVEDEQSGDHITEETVVVGCCVCALVFQETRVELGLV